MAEPLKYIYHNTFLDTYASILKKVIPELNEKKFRTQFNTKLWDDLELKQRMAFLTQATDDVLPNDLPSKINALKNIIQRANSNGAKDQNLEYIFLCDIITQHGMEDLATCIPAIEMLTCFISFEFAGRRFIQQHPEAMMAQMLLWTNHPNPNVRRYASEGCRPRLPWGLQLKQFVIDPSPIIPILEKLKNDPSEYVLKSVANNLNDISKDHPKLVIGILQKWKKDASPRMIRLLKQAARTLLKKGDKELLSLFGHHHHSPYVVEPVSWDKKSIHIGDKNIFQTTLTNSGKTQAEYRLEYFIYFVKANGLSSKKIFKIAEKTLHPGQSFTIQKSHTFADLTTRKHYPGTHQITIVINGQEGPHASFLLLL
ncbi:MAG: DNA alkylation repair protein [Saprospiraceae bacterium]